MMTVSASIADWDFQKLVVFMTVGISLTRGSIRCGWRTRMGSITQNRKKSGDKYIKTKNCRPFNIKFSGWQFLYGMFSYRLCVSRTVLPVTGSVIPSNAMISAILIYLPFWTWSKYAALGSSSTSREISSTRGRG